MKLLKLELKDFRNINSTQINLDQGINSFIGKNGEGKTSIIESISLLSGLRSFRTSSTNDCIRKSSEQSSISGILTDGTVKTELKIFLEGDRKKATINGKAYKNSVSYLKQRYGRSELGFHAIVFCPEDHSLIRGEPSERRSYLDRCISSESLEYLNTLSSYRRSLEQRNSLLKNAQGNPSQKDFLMWEGFTNELIQHGSVITQIRLQWLAEIGESFSQHLNVIAPHQVTRELFYIFSCKPTTYFPKNSNLPSIEEIKKALWDKAFFEQKKEWIVSQTRLGPHRDEFGFGSEAAPLRTMGSQGEIRSAVLALKFSEIDHFNKVTGHQPVLLLDDLSSELDHERKKSLLDYLRKSDLQVFITTTEDRDQIGTRFMVQKGKVERNL